MPKKKDTIIGIKYIIVSEHRVVIMVNVGHVSDREAFSAYKELFEDSRIAADYDYLMDVTNQASELRSSDALYHFSNLCKQWRTDRRSTGRIAVIAPRDLSYGLSRMFQEYAQEPDENYQVFRDAQKAVDWLGIPMSVLEEARGIKKGAGSNLDL